MTRSDVLAVVVSYNGLDQVRDTVMALRAQIDRVHIVDNGSDAPTLAVVEDLRRFDGVSVETLGVNRGIGHALNRGVVRAKEIGATWLLTMDHDTVADPALLSAFASAQEQRPDGVCFAPARGRHVGDGAPEAASYAISSGTIALVSVIDDIGPFDEGFFVDCIDFDFSLRLRRAGHIVYRVPRARMRHRLGERDDIPAPLAGLYAQHSPVRRYYMYRNFLYLVQRHARAFPWFIAKLATAQILLTVLIAFLDPRPGDSYRAIARGIRDFRTRKMGPYLETAI